MTMFAVVAFALIILALIAAVFLPGHRTHRLGHKWFVTIEFPTINIHSENIAFLDKVKISNVWFAVGSWATLLLILPSLVMLIYNLWTLVYKHFNVGTGDQSSSLSHSEPALQVIVPGYNLPLTDFGYYLVTLLIITVLHEFGHAAAARSEGIDIMDYGLMFFGLVPMAYVSLPTKDLDVASFKAKLRILTAGVWHNVVLTAMAYGLLVALPWIVAPAFHHHSGLLVTAVTSDSLLNGPSGLIAGDVITHVNGCQVDSELDFKACLIKAMNEPQVGWCIDESTGLQTSSQTLEKCLSNNTNQQNMCFEHSTDSTQKAFISLNVRQVLSGGSICRRNTSEECLAGKVCAHPTEHLTQVARRDKKDFLFVGGLLPMVNDLQVSSYRFRIENFPLFSINIFPGITEKMCFYIVILSSALAALNAIPCWRLDGHLILETVINGKLCYFLGPTARRKLTKIITHFGSFLLILNIVIGLLQTIL